MGKNTNQRLFLAISYKKVGFYGFDASKNPSVNGYLVIYLSPGLLGWDEKNLAYQDLSEDIGHLQKLAK